MADCDYDYEGPDETAVCPRCMGDGEVSCHCGGDLCICENHGDAPCSVCYGEGEVSNEKYDRYLRQEAEAHKAFRAAIERAEKEREQEQPTTAPETRQDRRSGVSAHGEPPDTHTGDTRG